MLAVSLVNYERIISCSGKKKLKSPEIPKFEMPSFFFSTTDVELIRKQTIRQN